MIYHSKDYNKIFTKLTHEGYDFLILSFKAPLRKNKNLIQKVKGIKRDLKILLFSHEKMIFQILRSRELLNINTYTVTIYKTTIL
ncbi:hypothetical protein ATB96_17480 [Elizabethkingia ursingii]|nr:hypothetical protein ATB96_17480 [Elizabethkingia ursingii]